MLHFLAALTSAISLHESVTAYVYENWNVGRTRASLIVSVGAMSVGVFCCLSFGVLSGWTVFGMNIFDLFDFTSSKIMLPVGGVLLSLFVGWYLDRKMVQQEFTKHGSTAVSLFPVVIFRLKWLAPVAIMLVFVQGIIDML